MEVSSTDTAAMKPFVIETPVLEFSSDVTLNIDTSAVIIIKSVFPKKIPPTL